MIRHCQHPIGRKCEQRPVPYLPEARLQGQRLGQGPEVEKSSKLCLAGCHRLLSHQGCWKQISGKGTVINDVTRMGDIQK